MTTLSRYSKIQDTSKRSIEYTSEIEYIEALSKDQQASTAGDFEKPYPFKDWVVRAAGLTADEEYQQYQQYVRDWYASRLEKNQVQISEWVKQDYINLIKNLKFIFRDSETTKWLTNINFDDNAEVVEAIPHISRKLKEIAIYLVNKKDAAKKTKIKYNMVGSTQSMERLFYEYLLKAFTQRDYVLNAPTQELWNTFPLLSAVKDDFQIQIEELYDDTAYFDKDPSVSSGQYYDLTSPELTSYYADRGFPIEDLDWLYQTGITPLVIENPLLWTLSDLFTQYNVDAIEDLPLSATDLTINNRLLDYYKIDMATKYLGSQQSVLSGGYYIPKVDEFTYDFQEGNNWFYWASGEHYHEVPTSYYAPIFLKDTTLISSSATGGLEYKEADKIFIEDTDGLHGAWLKKTETSTSQGVMSAQIFPFLDNLDGTGFQFQFPFPGYGVSAADVPYSGPGLTNFNSLYNLLNQDLKEAVLKQYWSLSPMGSSITPINIQDTSLIDSGALAMPYYNQADKIFIKDTLNENKINDRESNSVYQENFKRAWLYKFNKTDLPIKQNNTKLYWPLMYFDERDDLTFEIKSNQCAPLHLSSVDTRESMIGSRAGHGLFDSDIIYKLDSPDGYPVECAFLSGVEIEGLGATTWTAAATGVIQPAFTTKCTPGKFQTFIWQDDNININDTTITYKPHQIDCQYLNESHQSIFNNKIKSIDKIEGWKENGISQWKTCNCKAIPYSPFGHPGDVYDDYNRMTDILFVDTMFPSAFNIYDWRGTDNLPYNQSEDFAWYQVNNNQIEPDVGWGSGQWVDGTGSTNFVLKKGYLYKYLRHTGGRGPADILEESVPPLYIKQKYTNVPQPTWMKAELLEGGQWQKTYTPSNMVINPAESLYYDHIDSNWYCLTGNDNRYVTTTLGFSGDLISVESAWTNTTIASIDTNISLSWPTVIASGGPEYISNEVEEVSWTIFTPSTALSSLWIPSDYPYNIKVEETGVYAISATAILKNGDLYSFTDIPSVSVYPYYELSALEGSLDIKTIYLDTINFTWNEQLSGWNYDTNVYDITSLGGKPYWAEALDDDSYTTKFKGVNVYGGGIQSDAIDDYTFITQPKPSEIELEIGDAIEYRYMGNGEFDWIQPVTFELNEEKNEWCKLIINHNVTSPLSAYLYNLDKELVVSASDLQSDILLKQSCDRYTFINYYAQNAFTWTQELTDTSIGIPPSGGKWITSQTEIVVDPITPYANLTNRHFPTIATIPYIPNLYSELDKGGYAIPYSLGASVYLGKQYTTKFNTDNTDNVLYQDKDVFTSDYGLTNKKQETPVSTASINANWMKSSLTEGARAGFVNNVKTYQEFIPYQTKYETKRVSNIGIRSLNDDYTPWNGLEDNTWIDETNHPPNFRGEYPIESWYNQFPQIDNKMIAWETDIFGNNYGLFKDRNIERIYEEKQAIGELWVRDLTGRLGTSNTILSNVYNKLDIESSFYSNLSANEIKNFDIFYDVILFETESGIVLQKINFDYTTGEIASLADDFRLIEIEVNEYFAGYWFFENKNQLALCKVIFDAGIIKPIIYIYDLNNGSFRKFYDGELDLTLNDMSEINLSSINQPIFTYNTTTKTYNISFTSWISDDSIITGMIIGIINIDKQSKKSDVHFITPDASTSPIEHFQLVFTSLYNNNILLLGFENQNSGDTHFNSFNPNYTIELLLTTTTTTTPEPTIYYCYHDTANPGNYDCVPDGSSYPATFELVSGPYEGLEECGANCPGS